MVSWWFGDIVGCFVSRVWVVLSLLINMVLSCDKVVWMALCRLWGGFRYSRYLS